MVTLEVQQDVIRLRSMDYSYDKIASTLKVSKPKVMGICSDYDAEIIAMRQGQVKMAIKDASYVAEERSKLYRQLISRLHTEIGTRDITAVSTERLFTMLERTERSLSAIEQRTMPKEADLFADLSDEDLMKIANTGSSAANDLLKVH